MALPEFGVPLSLQQIQDEFGGTTPISLSEYYDSDTGVPASGTISIQDFYGKSAVPPVPPDITFLVVGGGGAGGSGDSPFKAAGGGAGGVVKEETFLLETGSYTITVGSGGNTSGASAGESRVFKDVFLVQSPGGGRGGDGDLFGPLSGGGGDETFTSGATRTDGGNGGNYSGSGGGGGGATGDGSNGSTSGGAGGAGTPSSITGIELIYGGGGGGGASPLGGDSGAGGSGGGGAGAFFATAEAGTDFRGGGGGGSTGGTGGNGGKGVVIVSIPDTITPFSEPVDPIEINGRKVYVIESSTSLTFTSI